MTINLLDILESQLQTFDVMLTFISFNKTQIVQVPADTACTGSNPSQCTAGRSVNKTPLHNFQNSSLVQDHQIVQNSYKPVQLEPVVMLNNYRRIIVRASKKFVRDNLVQLGRKCRSDVMVHPRKYFYKKSSACNSWPSAPICSELNNAACISVVSYHGQSLKVHEVF